MIFHLSSLFTKQHPSPTPKSESKPLTQHKTAGHLTPTILVMILEKFIEK